MAAKGPGLAAKRGGDQRGGGAMHRRLGLTGLALAAVVGPACSCPGLSGPGEATARLLRPVPLEITVPFGLQMHPLFGQLKPHHGVDFPGPSGTAIAAADAGEVVESHYKGGNGNYVLIRHRGGLATTYSHMARLAVKAGDCVERGQTVGFIGSTGLSAGPHLHFEVLIAGDFVDPAPLLLPVSGR